MSAGRTSGTAPGRRDGTEVLDKSAAEGDTLDYVYELDRDALNRLGRGRS